MHRVFRGRVLCGCITSSTVLQGGETATHWDDAKQESRALGVERVRAVPVHKVTWGRRHSDDSRGRVAQAFSFEACRLVVRLP